MDSYVKPITWILGVVLTLIGLLGFVMASPLLGIFQTDTVHNVIHLLSGVVALGAAASSMQYSRMYLIIFGLVYALVTIIGFVNGGNILGLFMVNQADNFLHLAIAVVSLVVGFGSSSKMSA